jgi:hypothetical protein
MHGVRERPSMAVKHYIVGRVVLQTWIEMKITPCKSKA